MIIVPANNEPEKPCVITTINCAAALMACGHIIRDIKRQDDGRLLFLFDESAAPDAVRFRKRDLFGSLPTAFDMARMLVRFRHCEINLAHIQEVQDAALAELDEAEN